jgi:hypothetical protein
MRRIITAGGLTSGIDLALRVVERYYGRKIAEQTAICMEYQGKAGWFEFFVHLSFISSLFAVRVNDK